MRVWHTRVPYLLLNRGGEADASVIFREDYAVNLDMRIQFPDNRTDIVYHAESVVGHRVSNHRYKQIIRGHQGVDGDKAEGWRAIKDDIIVFAGDGGEQLLQDGLPLEQAGNL